jgi:hypothetical protein
MFNKQSIESRMRRQSTENERLRAMPASLANQAMQRWIMQLDTATLHDPGHHVHSINETIPVAAQWIWEIPAVGDDQIYESFVVLIKPQWSLGKAQLKHGVHFILDRLARLQMQGGRWMDWGDSSILIRLLRIMWFDPHPQHSEVWGLSPLLRSQQLP